MNLVIVESPAKSKTIGKYLGKDYKITATMGHIMDLPKSKLGVDVEHNYKPDYEVMKDKQKVVRELRKLVKQNDHNIYLALDPDREGEAIAANVVEALKLKKAQRIVFHEITKDAILEAIKNPREVNADLVDAQKARRVLDRLVGYKLSELLWKKIWYGLSAGRVQSVATRLIVERERERLAFKPEEFWDILAKLETEDKKKFTAKLAQKNGKKYLPGNDKDAHDVESVLKKADWKVAKVVTKESSRHAFPPYTTSTLQQAANNYLGYGASRTMQLAQQLYQGVNIKGKGHVGLITYMRTDSTNLSAQAVKAARDYILSNFGDKYLPAEPNFYKTKSRLAQEAHEAIRPTDFTLTPEEVKDSLTPQQLKLYRLIWNRGLGSQMTPMQYNTLEVDIDANSGKDTYTFKVKGYDLLFDGFAKVVGSAILREDDVAENLSGIKEGDKLDCKDLELKQNFTKPRARYTEATLVKALESHGIGRPSTYATIISTIQNRGYVGKDGRYLFPTDVGFVVTDFLVKHFNDIVDYDFTSEIEEELDEIAEGKLKWVPVVDKVYVPFSKDLVKKGKEVKKEDVVILGNSDIKCPNCGGKMVERLGRNGRFLSCAKFPECKGMLGIDGKPMEQEVDLKLYEKPGPCEKCGGEMVVKSGKYGKFLACKNYPDCKSTAPLLLKEVCPECGSHLVEKRGRWGKSFIGCSGYPKCKYIKKVPKADNNEKKEEGVE